MSSSITSDVIAVIECKFGVDGSILRVLFRGLEVTVLSTTLRDLKIVGDIASSNSYVFT